jgi:hypothetical protein
MSMMTMYCCPASIVRATTRRSQLSFHRFRRSRNLTLLLYLSRAASWTQSPVNSVLGGGATYCGKVFVAADFIEFVGWDLWRGGRQ